jgi:hypothetical protein
MARIKDWSNTGQTLVKAGRPTNDQDRDNCFCAHAGGKSGSFDENMTRNRPVFDQYWSNATPLS